MIAYLFTLVSPSQTQSKDRTNTEQKQIEHLHLPEESHAVVPERACIPSDYAAFYTNYAVFAIAKQPMVYK